MLVQDTLDRGSLLAKLDEDAARTHLADHVDTSAESNPRADVPLRQLEQVDSLLVWRLLGGVVVEGQDTVLALHVTSLFCLSTCLCLLLQLAVCCSMLIGLSVSLLLLLQLCTLAELCLGHGLAKGIKGTSIVG